MSALLEDVMKMAEQLNSDEQNLLIQRLRIKQLETSQSSLNRAELLQVSEALRQTSAKPEDSLLGKYAKPNLPDVSEADFHSQMHNIVTNKSD